MKKLLMIILALILVACGSSKKEAPAPPEILETDDIDTKAEKYVQWYIDSGYRKTTIDRITMNPNMGTEESGDYVALVYLVWDVQNHYDTAKKMLETYSSDMAARMYEDLPEVSELVVFWDVTYLDTTMKFTFERVDGGMKFAN